MTPLEIENARQRARLGGDPRAALSRLWRADALPDWRKSRGSRGRPLWWIIQRAMWAIHAGEAPSDHWLGDLEQMLATLRGITPDEAVAESRAREAVLGRRDAERI